VKIDEFQNSSQKKKFLLARCDDDHDLNEHNKIFNYWWWWWMPKKYFWVYKKESFEIHLFLLIQCFKLLYIMCNWHMVTGGENLFMTNSILEVNFFHEKYPTWFTAQWIWRERIIIKKNPLFFKPHKKSVQKANKKFERRE